MGNCVVLQRETTWLNEEEEEEEHWELLQKPSLQQAEMMTEVKIRITKKQLERFLTGNKLPLERVLEEIVSNGVVHHDHEHIREGHWKPRLQSIPEIVEER